jgi:hypothetical protein
LRRCGCCGLRSGVRRGVIHVPRIRRNVYRTAAKDCNLTERRDDVTAERQAGGPTGQHDGGQHVAARGFPCGNQVPSPDTGDVCKARAVVVCSKKDHTSPVTFRPLRRPWNRASASWRGPSPTRITTSSR